MFFFSPIVFSLSNVDDNLKKKLNVYRVGFKVYSDASRCLIVVLKAFSFIAIIFNFLEHFNTHDSMFLSVRMEHQISASIYSNSKHFFAKYRTVASGTELIQKHPTHSNHPPFRFLFLLYNGYVIIIIIIIIVTCRHNVQDEK